MARLLIIVLLWFTMLPAASVQVPFEALAEPLKQSTGPIEKLSQQAIMQPNKMLLRHYLESVASTLLVGQELANAKDIDREIVQAYLKELRELSRKKESIDALYRQSLNKAIDQSDKKSFEDLVSVPLEPLHQPRIRSDVIAFYQKNFPKNSIKSVDALCDDQKLESDSLQYIAEQEQAYEEHLKILKRADAQKIKRSAKIGSRNSVMVVEETKANGDIVFEAENLNPFLVTLSLDFEKLTNLKSDHSLPLYVEVPGRTKKEILRLIPILKSAATEHLSSYGWLKGSAFAQHDDSYVYQLPFAKGSSVEVSQGYNGGLSHKGLSSYAIDFPLPVGTPIYAAREGDVVGVDVSNDIGGASPAYRPYMNFVNIRHADGTLGNYFHLKRGGSAVKIGDKVKKGQLIAYSGSTGYCTAPHLHFSVSKVDPVSMRRPMNLPVKIQTMQGLVTNPCKGDRYTVQ